MTLNHVKQGRAVTFMKYLAGAVSLIFLVKILFGITSRFRHQIRWILQSWW